MPSAVSVHSAEVHARSSRRRGSGHLQGLTLTFCSCCWDFQVCHEILKGLESCHTSLGTLPVDYLELCHNVVRARFWDRNPSCLRTLHATVLSFAPQGKLVIAHRRVLGGRRIVRYAKFCSVSGAQCPWSFCQQWWLLITANSCSFAPKKNASTSPM